MSASDNVLTLYRCTDCGREYHIGCWSHEHGGRNAMPDRHSVESNPFSCLNESGAEERPCSGFQSENPEQRARSLIGAINGACRNAEAIFREILNTGRENEKSKKNNSLDKDDIETILKLEEKLQNLEQQHLCIKSEISSLSGQLAFAKSEIASAMCAMEANSSLLESRRLNTQSAQPHLESAAAKAWAEAQRLNILIREIETALDEAYRASSGDGPSDLVQSCSETELPQGRAFYPNTGLDDILTGFNSARGLSSDDDNDLGNYGPNDSGGEPQLGGTPPPGFDATLKKIPDLAIGTIRINANPFNGGLYVDDAYYGSMELSYDPYNPVAGPMAMGAMLGHPIAAHARSDGGYTAYGSGSMPYTFDQGIAGGW